MARIVVISSAEIDREMLGELDHPRRDREHSPDRIVVALRRGGEDATWLEDLGSVPGAIAGIPITRIAL